VRVVLTGFMGTGKTAVGQRVAARLHRPLLDTDALVEQACGCSVREIFAAKGEPYFRACERRAVAEACAAGDVVVSTGGGAIVDPQNLARLRDGGLVVCLTATPQAIARRVRATAAARPLLAGHPSLAGRIRELLAQRAATYARVPLQIDTTGLSVDQVAGRVVKALARAERSPAARGAARARRPQPATPPAIRPARRTGAS
jgi:shikimate kinase